MKTHSGTAAPEAVVAAPTRPRELVQGGRERARTRGSPRTLSQDSAAVGCASTGHELSITQTRLAPFPAKKIRILPKVMTYLKRWMSLARGAVRALDPAPSFFPPPSRRQAP